MNNPFEVLGLTGWSDQEEIRTAYRALVKKCHPDLIQDPVLRQEAQERMARLNVAYEEAIRLTAPRGPGAPGTAPGAPPQVSEELSGPAALLMAERSLARNNPEGALRQLLKCTERDGDWYYMQGRVLMAMEQYESAHQSFREAVRRCPENNVYRSGALAAVVAQREAESLQGRMKKVFKKIVRK